MKNKIFNYFSSNIKINVQGKNINNFMRKLIRNNINIYKFIPISHNEINIIINYKDLEKIEKLKTVYNITIIKYYGKLKILKIIKKNIYLLSFLLLGICLIFFLSNIIFDIEIIHSNSNLIKTIDSELTYYGIKKYSFVKSYDYIEQVENKILENNKDKIEWIEIIRIGTKYVVRVEERIINKKRDDNKIYNIVTSKNAVLKEVKAESGEKIKSINSYLKKGEIVISSDITLPNNEKKVDSASGNIIGEVWYNVSIEYPFHYHEVKYTGKKKKVLVYNINNIRVPFFDFHKFNTFDKDIKYIFNNLLFPINLHYEYQYETNIIDKTYDYETAREMAILKAKEKLTEKYDGITNIFDVIIVNETENTNKIELNLFIKALEDITEYIEVIPDNA